MTTTTTTTNTTPAPKVGQPSEGRKPVTMRLTKHAVTARNTLARAWGCPKTDAVEQALALCERLAITGSLPPLLKDKGDRRSDGCPNSPATKMREPTNNLMNTQVLAPTATDNRLSFKALLGSVGSRVALTITRSSLDHIRIVLRSTEGTVELRMTCEDLALALTGLAERPASIARHTKQRLSNVKFSETDDRRGGS